MLNKRRLFALGLFVLLVMALFSAFALVSQPVNSALAQDDPDGGDMQAWFEWAVSEAEDEGWQIVIDFVSRDFTNTQLSPASRREVIPVDRMRFIGSDYVCFAYGETAFSNLGCVPYVNINEFGTYDP
ncbi:MAG: hypothetical protein SF123_19805 [Chloroflexota bacterium]|nr:hypothetical protein [Chloroflexota bacterium]